MRGGVTRAGAHGGPRGRRDGSGCAWLSRAGPRMESLVPRLLQAAGVESPRGPPHPQKPRLLPSEQPEEQAPHSQVVMRDP